MCASFQARLNVTQLVKAFDKAGAPLALPAGLPNIEPVDEVRPTDTALAVRTRGDGTCDLAPMRFGFPPPRPKAGPVINFRSEGRSFANGPNGGRCLVPVSGFYEFTGDKYPKTRWIFRDAEAPILALAAVWRAGEGGDAFSLLTAEPGPDVAAYHDRGVLPLPAHLWPDWLFGRREAGALLTPAPAGFLTVEAAPRP